MNITKRTGKKKTKRNGSSKGILLQRWNTRHSTFSADKLLHEFRDSSWNIDSVWATRNITYRNYEMVPLVWRLLQDLTVSEREVTVQSRSGSLRSGNYRSRQFSSDSQVQTAVLSWLQDQRAIFYRQGIERLVERSDKCLQRYRDCVGKQCAFCVTYCIVTLFSIKCFLAYIIQV